VRGSARDMKERERRRKREMKGGKRIVCVRETNSE
jgi:hypothetical protein